MRPLLKITGYGVTREGRRAVLQVGNSALPMTWDVAIRMGARIRVATRNAQEYIGMSRIVKAGEGEAPKRMRAVIREHDTLLEGEYEVYSEGPDIIVEVGNAKLTMGIDVSMNISSWLTNTGREINDLFFPDMHMKFHVAQLTDATVEEVKKQSRRDATGVYQ